MPIKKRSRPFLADFLRSRSPEEATKLIINYALDDLEIPRSHLRKLEEHPLEIKKQRTRLKSILRRLEQDIRHIDRTKCGQMMVRFVNSRRAEEAVRGLIDDALSHFGFSEENLNREGVGTRGPTMSRELRDEVKMEQRRMSQLLLEVQSVSRIEDSERLSFYIHEYNGACRTFIDFQPEGRIHEYPVFGDGEYRYDDILAYCVVTFYETGENKDLIRACDYGRCPRFFIVTRSDRRYCSDGCRVRAHGERTGKGG